MEQNHLSPLSGARSLLLFFLLVFAFSIPFWLLGAATGLELLPGLPIASLMTFCPMLAAMVLVYRKNRGVGVAVLLKRAFDLNRIEAKVWYVPVLLLMPVVMALSFFVLRLTGTPVPLPKIALLPTLALAVAFFVAALGEELGWSGYATDPMQSRWGALSTSLILGVIWAIYHYIALAQAHRSVTWIAWWTLSTLALRIIIVWLYNNTGRSVFAAALFHMTINVTWQLFPVNGSYYDPRVSGSILALAAIIIIVIWGPQTLERNKSDRDRPIGAN